MQRKCGSSCWIWRCILQTHTAIDHFLNYVTIIFIGNILPFPLQSHPAITSWSVHRSVSYRFIFPKFLTSIEFASFLNALPCLSKPTIPGKNSQFFPFEFINCMIKFIISFNCSQDVISETCVLRSCLISCPQFIPRDTITLKYDWLLLRRSEFE